MTAMHVVPGEAGIGIAGCNATAFAGDRSVHQPLVRYDDDACLSTQSSIDR